jgi:hypothetical protein
VFESTINGNAEAIEGHVTAQTSSFPPAHKSNVGMRALCHLPSANSSGGRFAFTWRTCLVLVVTTGGTSDDDAAVVDVCVNVRCPLVDRLERED